MTDEQPVDEQPTEQPVEHPIPSPSAFLTMAAGAKRNGDDALSRGDLEGAGMWRTLEQYLRDGARASAYVPPQVRTVVAASIALLAEVSESGVRRARRVSTGGGNAYVPYEYLIALIDSLEGAFPGLVDQYTEKRLTA